MLEAGVQKAEFAPHPNPLLSEERGSEATLRRWLAVCGQRTSA